MGDFKCVPLVLAPDILYMYMHDCRTIIQLKFMSIGPPGHDIQTEQRNVDKENMHNC